MENLDLQANNIDLEAAAHLLTQQEKTLCLQLDLKPTQYLTQKALIIQVSDHYLYLLILRMKIYQNFTSQKFSNLRQSIF